jgi:hypothetical protein
LAEELVLRRSKAMSKIKLFAFITLTTLAFGIAVVGDALAGEKIKVQATNVFHITEATSHPVEDVEGHVLILYKGEGVELLKGGELVSTLNLGYLDYIKGTGPFHGYTTSTYRDGSTIVSKWQGEATVSEWKGEGSEKVLVIRSGKGANIFVGGTGRFKGIEGRGTFSYTTVTPRWVVAEEAFEYTLP